jgi:hypothetical protein
LPTENNNKKRKISEESSLPIAFVALEGYDFLLPDSVSTNYPTIRKKPEMLTVFLYDY